MKGMLVLTLGLVLTAGCASPLQRAASPQQGGGAPSPRAVAAARPSISRSVRSPAAPTTPGVVGATVGDLAQVGYRQPVCPPDKPGGCLPVHGHACPPQSPSGYAQPVYPPWNAYGADPQEFLCDGGDRGNDVMLRRDDTLAGLDPEDTVVHYTTEAGDIEIEASNRVCVYAPRFGSVRRITGALAGGRAVTASQVDRPQGTNAVEYELPGLVVTDATELAHADVARRVDAMRDRNRGVPIESVLQPEQADDVLAALAGLTALSLNEIQDDQKLLLERYATAAIAWTLDEALEVAIADVKPPTLTRDEHVAGLTIYEFPDAGRLRICKLADRQQAQPGELVSFSIQVTNVGDSPVSHVTITDNLVTRLAYVPESQTASVGAVFETADNAGESLRLQWTLTDTLKVGETATIRFRCRVR